MDVNNRYDFLKVAGAVEGGTLLLALGLGWALGISPGQYVEWTWPAVGLGLLATLPIFLVYFFARETRSVAVELMGGPLSRCRWYELVVLAALAGIGEELLFRGVLQPWLSRSFTPLTGLLAANVLFGVVHMVTPVYALLATGIGVYLSGVAHGLEQGNLLSAMIAHGVYDYVAFLLIAREYRNSTREDDDTEPRPADGDLQEADHDASGSAPLFPSFPESEDADPRHDQ
jgi:uncharacterized protein